LPIAQVMIFGCVCFILRGILMFTELWAFAVHNKDPTEVWPRGVYLFVALLFFLGAEVVSSFAVVITLMRPKPEGLSAAAQHEIDIAIDKQQPEGMSPPAPAPALLYGVPAEAPVVGFADPIAIVGNGNGHGNGNGNGHGGRRSVSQTQNYGVVDS
jgi:hypothetical protein